MRSQIRHPIGMALGGGAARGSAHAGVFKALQDYPQFFPDIITGTSVGSIAAALYACGLDLETIMALTTKIRWLQDVIRLPGKNLATTDFGFLSNSGLQKFINSAIRKRCIEDTEIPLIITACDLQKRVRILFTDPYTAKSLNKGILQSHTPPPAKDLPGIETIVIDDVKDIGLMICASCSIPQIFRPVKVRGFELSDGGVLDQIPVNPLRAYGAKTIIAVYLGLTFIEKNNMVAPTLAMFAMRDITRVQRYLKEADLPIYLKELEGHSLTQTGDSSPITLAETKTREVFDRFLHKRKN